jgi:hypothetical protein
LDPRKIASVTNIEHIFNPEQSQILLTWYDDTREKRPTEEQPEDFVLENSLFVHFYRLKLNQIIAYDKEETSIDAEDLRLMEETGHGG